MAPPLHIEKKFQKLFETGSVNNQAGLARRHGMSRARIMQIMKLLDDSVFSNVSSKAWRS